MRWEEVPAIDRNGIIVTYEVVFESVERNSTPKKQNVTASSRGTTLAGLQEYVRYNISVRASTSVGPGPYSTPLTVITDEDGKHFVISLNSFTYTSNVFATAPSATPENVVARAISSTQILVTWEEVPLDHQNGVITTYEVLIVPQLTFDGSLMESTTNVTNTSLLLDDLHPFLNYTISVRAYTSVGAGPYQSVIESTLEDRRLPNFNVLLNFNIIMLPLNRSSQLSNECHNYR